MKEISVLITVYNCENYLRDCLDSVVNQTFNKDLLEVIIVDDCSTDNSVEICKEYTINNPNWKLIINKSNQGCATSRNIALKNATGNYIVILDSDDMLYKESLETLHDVALKTDSDIVIARLNAFNQNGEYGYYSDKYINKNQLTNLYKNHKLINCISVCSKLYKRELIKDLKFLENVTHEDNYFTMLALLNYEKVFTLKKPLYYRRIRDIKKDSIMQNLNYKTYADLLKNYKYVITDFQSDKKKYFLHLYMIKKASNYIVNHLKKMEINKGKQELRNFINFLYYDNYIKKIRKNYYLVYFTIYYNIARIYKGVIG